MDELEGTHIVPEEIIRLMGATLQRMGKHTTVASLESETGVSINSPELESLRRFIVDGNWEESISLLEKMELRPTVRKKLLVAVTEQYYREIVMVREDPGPAADLLTRLTTMEEVDKELTDEFDRKIQELTLMITFDPPNPPPRIALLTEIERTLNPGEFVANGLIALLEESISNQNTACRYHNSEQEKYSLFGYHYCTRDENLPSTLRQTTTDHSGDIFYVQFSNNGHYLASFGSDSTIIWDIYVDNRLHMKHQFAVLKEDADAAASLGYMCWSPDDTKLLITRNGKMRMWKVDGICVGRFPPGEDVLSCCWTLDSYGKSLIFTSNRDNTISMWEGFDLIRTWKNKKLLKPQICIKNKKELVFVSDWKTVSILDWEREEDELKLTEEQVIGSFSLSKDGKCILVASIGNSVTMWKIDGPQPKKMKVFYDSEVRIFELYLGGLDDAFVATTSNNAQVHIWKRFSSKTVGELELLCTLEVHGGDICCIGWNPSDPTMLVSGAGNDLQVWGTV